MLSSTRTRLPFLLSQTSAITRRYIATTPPRNENREQPNTSPAAGQKSPPPNVSATNATPVSAIGAYDAPLVELPEEGEAQRQMQAPNRKSAWSRSQQPRTKAMVGPRFEQTIIEHQVSPDIILTRWLKEASQGAWWIQVLT